MNIPSYAIPSLLGSFAFLSLGVLVFFNQPRTLEKTLFSVLCLETFNWQVVWFLSFLVTHPSTIDFLAKFAYLSITFLPYTFYHFIVVFLKEAKEAKYVKASYGLGLILISLLFSTDLYVRGHREFWWGNFAAPGPLYPLFMVSGLMVMVRGLFILRKALRNPDRYSMPRGQIQCLLWGLGSYFFCALDFSQVYGFTWYPVGTFFFLLSYSIVSYTLIHYQFLDPEKIAEAFQREKLAAVGILAASMNHELRNPLYVAQGTLESYLENLKEGIYEKDDALERLKKAAETSLRQLTRAMEIMQRFSDFVKPQPGKDHFEKVPLSELIERVLQLVKFQFDLNKIQCTQEIQDGILIFGNRRELEEIFLNLILNACQAMKESGGKLHIKAHRGAEKVEIQIRDTGPGIPQEMQKRLFQPFSTSREQGTGLGLYITKQLVERNGGKISFETSPKGTTFVVRVKSSLH